MGKIFTPVPVVDILVLYYGNVTVAGMIVPIVVLMSLAPQVKPIPMTQVGTFNLG